MKKIILAVILIVILAGAGTPFFSGLVAEQMVKKCFSDINKRYADAGSDISLEIIRYDRHFFSSRIEWKLRPGSLKAVYGLEEIVFIDRVKHGFASVVSITSLEKNKWFKEFVSNRLNGQNPLEIMTKYTFFSNIESRLALDAFSFKDGNNVIEIMPGAISISFDPGVKNISSEMSWTGCSFPGKFRMDNLSFHLKMKKISAYIWDGKFSFVIKKIAAYDSKEMPEILNLKCDYTMDYNGEEHFLSIGMGYGIDSIRSGRDEIKNAFVRIGLNRIDVRGYEDFMAVYSQTINNAMKDIAASQQRPDAMKKTAEKQMAAVGFQMLGAYEKLLRKGFEIKISDLRARLPQGNIKGDVTLSLKKDMTMARFVPIMMQPESALDIFSLKSDVSLPYKLLGNNQMLLSPIYPGTQTGLFLRDGDHVTHKAETRDGKLYLNGKQVVFN